MLSHYAETSCAVRLLEGSSRAVGYLVEDRVQDTARLTVAIDRVGGGEVVIDPMSSTGCCAAGEPSIRWKP